MTWGSHCCVCGRDSCRWSLGPICEGKIAPATPDGYRISIMLVNAGYWVYYVEKRYPRSFFWHRWVEWVEVEGTREQSWQEALARLVTQTAGRIYA